MSLKNSIRDEWHHVLGLANSSGMPQSFRVDVQGGRLVSHMTAINPLACALETLTLHAPQLANATSDQLDRIATTLSQRLSYLLEPISAVETDQDACVVQMRSNPPQRDDDGTSYYELVVRRGELSLCRYSKAAGHPRRVISAHVTSEVFDRLAADFVAVSTAPLPAP